MSKYKNNATTKEKQQYKSIQQACGRIYHFFGLQFWEMDRDPDITYCHGGIHFNKEYEEEGYDGLIPLGLDRDDERRQELKSAIEKILRRYGHSLRGFTLKLDMNVIEDE